MTAENNRLSTPQELFAVEDREQLQTAEHIFPIIGDHLFYS